MGKDTAISWADHTFNPWIGCTKVSPGCANCYAATDTFARVKRGQGVELWGNGKPRHRTSADYWKDPVKWNKAANMNAYELRQTGRVTDCDGAVIEWHRPRVFCASLSDWLDDEVPIEWLTDLLDLIRRTPNLDWLLLTKRPENWLSRITAAFHDVFTADSDNDPTILQHWISRWFQCDDPPANVWLGTTIENQEMAEKRIPELLAIPAKIRFLSCEPLLEAVDLSLAMRGWDMVPRMPGGEPEQVPTTIIDWLIAGGESGPGFREFNPDWARSLRDQCKAANVAFHMKQMGGHKPSMMPPIPDDLAIREWPKGGAL